MISKTKIIATIGPASRDKEILRQMILEGMDVARINLSHDNQEIHLKTIEFIRELNKELNTHVAILADLQGPKIRLGNLETEYIVWNDGDVVEITTEKIVGNQNRVSVDYEDLAADIKPGEEILIDDGKIKLVCIETDGKSTIKAKVIYGGKVLPRKGVNLPNTSLSLPSMTEKDIIDANFAIENDVDWIALSFVRQVSDVIELKQLIRRKKKKINVIAKIEKPQALANLDEIIKVSDAIMVARGDLGVELDFEKVPIIQKQIVEKCILYHKPVIIATQMLESMIENFRPTRAEANDIANAVLDGADTLMLSGETSLGKHPILAIKSMQKIITYTEENFYRFDRGTPPDPSSERFVRDAVCYSASRMAQIINAKAIVTFTESGNTAFTISGYRPKANIYAFTPTKEILSVLSLLWGVKAFYFKPSDDLNKSINDTILILKKEGYLKPGDYVIHVGSLPEMVSGKTNIMKVTRVE